MGSKLQKRVGQLQKQVRQDDGTRLYIGRTFFLAFLFLVILSTSVFPEKSVVPLTQDSDESISPGTKWEYSLAGDVDARVDYLKNSFFGSMFSSAYEDYTVAVFSAFAPSPEAIAEHGELSIIDLESWSVAFWRGVCEALLRFGFIFYGGFFLWIILGFGLYGIIWALPRMNPTDDLLGACSRAKRVFYSGIYGALRPNQSMSGTDYSCPGLACPNQANAQTVAKHILGRILKSYRALNETNLQLAQVILAYPNYPSLVPEEKSGVDNDEGNESAEAIAAAQLGVISNAEGTIEKSASTGLAAVLEAHRALQRYFQNNGNNGSTTQQNIDSFTGHMASLNQQVAKLSPLAKTLALRLTASRARAIAQLPSTLVASAYLATEAGKCLVFQPSGNGFVQISRFPHLQARAVIQSIVPYHKEYNGDARLVIRQAIICSRRHGDFGRTFLPYNMPLASRALRDWLEILYAPPKKQNETASLVELDSQIEEMRFIWKKELSERIKNWVKAQPDQLSVQNGLIPASRQPYPLWKGIVHKSVVLVPLNDLVEIICSGISSGRQKHIFDLVEKVRSIHVGKSISGRLPGFQRQMVETEKAGVVSGETTALLAMNESEKDLVEKWHIVRRMLTRYNWLSTRVGDDNVPSDGLVKATIVQYDGEGKAQVLGFSALVPLRTRRYQELFGENWERTYFYDCPHPNDVEVFVEQQLFDETFAKKKELAAKGLLDASPSQNSVSVASA